MITEVDAMISMKNIQKIYHSGKIETAALRGISLEVVEGEFLMLTGKSGCGKTTLLSILGGMEQASSGEYRFEGVEVSGMKPRQEEKSHRSTAEGGIGGQGQTLSLPVVRRAAAESGRCQGDCKSSKNIAGR